MKDQNAVKIVSEHTKQFRFSISGEKEMTQEAAAEALGISKSTLKRYEKGLNAPSETTARDMERLTGIIYPYWMGKTECKTWAEFYAEIEQCESENMGKYAKEKAEELEQRRIFFNRCGYHYKSLENDAAHDFSELIPNPNAEIIYQSYHPHQLTSFNEPAKHYYFNQEELDDLISRMKDMVDLACFRKGQATQQTEERENRMEIETLIR